MKYFTKHCLRRTLIACIFLLFHAIGHSQTTETFTTGSFIVNLNGPNSTLKPQALKPYGLIYDLLRTDKIPIKWIISQTKAKDGIDFTYNGVSYKGSAFIIPKEYISTAISTKISNWVAQGVDGSYTVSPLTLDVYKTMISVPKWTLDAQNGAIAEGIILNAGINNTAFPGAYNWKTPASLGCCDDFFVMPHADPTWATHGNLWQWNQTCKGTIWAGCHAVSVLENMTNPSNPAQKTNFLSSNGLVLFGSHSGGSVPYTHRLPNDPVAQYLGVTDLAQLNGSEQIYIPNTAGGSQWRAGTNIIAYDPSQADVPAVAADLSNAASVIVYGRGFGNVNNGYVMYEASHSINKGSANDIAAQKAFFNFSFFQVIEKSPILPAITSISANQTVPVSTTVNCNIGAATSIIPGTTFTYQWTATAGTFTPASGLGQNVTWTAPAAAGNYSITCVVTDNCGRSSFQTVSPIKVTPPPVSPVAVADTKSVNNSCLSSVTAITYDVMANDYDPQGATVTFTGLNQAAASPANAGVWTSSGNGNVTFTPDPNFSGTATITYNIQNAGGVSATGTITANIGQLDSHGCTPSNVWAVAVDELVTTADISAVGNAAGITGELSTDPSLDDQEGTFTTAATDFIDMGTNTTSFIDIHLPVTLNTTDTVVIHWGKRTNAGTTVLSLKQSATSTFSGSATNLTISGSGNVPTDTRYGMTANGMNYIRVQVGTGTTQQLYIDGIEYEQWSCVSRVPALSNDAVVVLEDATANINVLANDMDPAGGLLTVSGIVTPPTRGKLSINLDNTITYIPNTDNKLSDFFVYRANTSDGYSDTARVTISISADACAAGSYSPLPTGGATTTTFIASRDNYIKQNSANTVQTSSSMSVGFTPSNVARALFYFDLSTIPTNAIVTSATFQVYRTAGNTTAQYLTNHKLNTGLFVENQVTWNNWSTGNAWPTAGGGNFAAREDSVPVGNFKQYFSWNAGTMAQSWIATPANNLGMILKGGGILNKSHTFADRTVAGKQPKLTVTYILPAACVAIPANRAPLANPDTVSTDRATAKIISPLTNDDDINGAGTINLAASNPIVSVTGGTCSVSGNNITFTPTIPGSPGVATITYRIQDAGGLFDTSIVYVRIANAAPVALNDFPTAANSGTAQSFNVGTNDSDAEGAALTYRIYQDGKRGSSTISGSTITYTPLASYTGKDTVYYEITEAVTGCSSGLKDSAYVVFTMLNRTPTAVNDSKNTLPCRAVTFTLTSNDTDPESGALSVTNLSGLTPNIGSLRNNNDGTVTFTPNTGASGSTSFTYTVTDDGVAPLTSAPETVTINLVNPANNAPVIVNDYADTTNVDAVLYQSVADNDSDPDDNALTNPTITVNPLHGTAVVLANGLIKYTPNSGFFGADTLTYSTCDIINNPLTCVSTPSQCATAKLFIYVKMPNSVNAVNDENSTWVNVPVSGGVITNDFDLERDLVSFTAFLNTAGTAVASGSITVSGVDANGNAVANAGTLSFNSTGSYTYSPANNFIGVITVPYTIIDNNGNPAVDTAVLQITVSPVYNVTNSVIANNDDNISYGNPVNGNLFANDRDPQGNSFSLTQFKYDTDADGIAETTGTPGSTVTVAGITSGGAKTTTAGTFTVNASGQYTFTPAADFHGSVDIPYTICDNGAPVACATAILHINVLGDINGPLNDPPLAGDDFNITNINTPVSGNFVNNDTEPNVNPISVNSTTINVGGAHNLIQTLSTQQGGTMQFYSDGTYTYTPLAGYSGPDLVNYTICDVTVVSPQPLCHTGTVHLLIAAPFVVPIDLLSFRGKRSGKDNLLQWSTVQESNSSRFEVENSMDNASFVKIGSVAAKGNSGVPSYYSFIHYAPADGIQYYRLKMIDLSGRYKYSKVIAIRADGNGVILQSVYPNPFRDKLELAITSEKAEELTIILYDAQGKAVHSGLQQVVKGLNSIIINGLNRLAPGSYFIEVKGSTDILRQKLFKMP